MNPSSYQAETGKKTSLKNHFKKFVHHADMDPHDWPQDNKLGERVKGQIHFQRRIAW